MKAIAAVTACLWAMTSILNWLLGQRWMCVLNGALACFYILLACSSNNQGD